MFAIQAKTKKEEDLISQAKSVSDSYFDFVLGLLLSCRVYDITDKMVEFMKSNPDTTTSDILRFQGDLIAEDDERRVLMGLPTREEMQEEQ